MDTDKHLITIGSTIKHALEKLNALGSDLTLFVTDDNSRLVGTITDGDIRRGMLQGRLIDEPVDRVMNTHFTALRQGNFSLDDVKKIRERLIKLVPVLNAENRIVKLFNLQKIRTILPMDSVIMAGGEGTRLRPLTDHVPKPLLKIGEKPILEYNLDRLCEFGVENFYVTIKYLGNQIRDQFKDGSERGVSIHYIEEHDEPLGTIGSVSLIESFAHDNVLVMNSDILTNIDYEDFFLEFRNRDADMAVATIPYQVKIPYAVLETNKDLIVGFKEKPTYTYHSSAGIYLFKKEALKLIPKGRKYNATDLMDHLIASGRKVITYAMYCYWLDIGKPEDFKKAQEDIHHIKF